jgi:hypothetical protein
VKNLIKKIILTIIIIGLALMVGIQVSGGYGFIKDILNKNETLFLTKTNEIELDSISTEVILRKDCYYKKYENYIEIYDYNGALINKKEFQSFIEKVYIDENKYVMTEDGNIYSLNLNENITFDLKNKKIINIKEDYYTFLINSDNESNLNFLDIYDNESNFIGTLEYNQRKIINVQKSKNSNGIIVVSFNYEGAGINTNISEYLPNELLKTWSIDLNGEIVLFAISQKEGLYLATNMNLYRLNSSGKILWKYGGFGKIKDFDIVGDNVVLLSESGNTYLHLISKEGKVINKIESEYPYSTINKYNDIVILTSNKYLSYLNGDKINLLHNSSELMNGVIIENENLRVSTVNRITSYKINIK